MCHAAASSFGAFFALRFLLGELLQVYNAMTPQVEGHVRHVRVLRCAHPHPYHHYVLQEGRTGLGLGFVYRRGL